MSLFVTFEGPEGSGKTTAAKRVVEELEKRGYQCLLTREPGGSEIAEQIRNVLLDKNNTLMDRRTEALLYAASRRQHLIEKVLPALQEGKIVICDRYVDSSLAYQGHARNIGIDEVLSINSFAIDGKMPDLTIFFDLDEETGLRRINIDKKREVNRLDLEKLDFHKKVYEGYKILVDRYPERIKSIDASKSVEEVSNSVLEVILSKL